MGEWVRLGVDGLRAARGDGPLWSSLLLWGLLLSIGALVADAQTLYPLLNHLATPLLLVAGMVWMALMVRLAARGPDLLAGFVLAWVVAAFAARLIYLLVR